MAHLARQHGLVFQGVPKLRVGLLALDGDAEQPGEAGEEIGIGEVELAGFGAVGFEDAEWQMAFAAPHDQDVDGAPDAVVGEQFRRTEAALVLKMVEMTFFPVWKA
jgi:hypothetical protein